MTGNIFMLMAESQSRRYKRSARPHVAQYSRSDEERQVEYQSNIIPCNLRLCIAAVSVISELNRLLIHPVIKFRSSPHLPNSEVDNAIVISILSISPCYSFIGI